MTQYESLRKILNDAYDQASIGKGSVRHANGLPFERQPILEITRITAGFGGPAFQAAKKITEAHGMFNRGEHDAAKKELLGAIVYLAALCIYVDEREEK